MKKKAKQRRALESHSPGAGPNGGHKSIAAEAGKYNLDKNGMQAFEEFSLEWAKEALRVLKPGGHLLSFASCRTYHRMACGIEKAGFEIRDQIMWIFGSGFPKSHNISIAIDKAAGVERSEVIGTKHCGLHHRGGVNAFTDDNWQAKNRNGDFVNITAPASESAKQWEGWGTALKPANEPVVVARKPLEKDLTVAANVIKWGTGALNIKASRIELNGDYKSKANGRPSQTGLSDNYDPTKANQPDNLGRWPANIIFDEEAAAVLDEQSGNLTSGKPGIKKQGNNGAAYGAESRAPGTQMSGFGDSGGASRFFYVAKASRSERNRGLEGMEKKDAPGSKRSAPAKGRKSALGAPRENFHPTVKPVKLMEHLIKLVTPPNGTVLDPFMGSGTTGVAAKHLGFNFIGCELSSEYMEIAKKRIDSAQYEEIKIIETNKQMELPV